MSGATVRMTRGESELGRWEIAAAPPDPTLAPGVRGYVGVASALTLTAERHLPSGEAAILVNLGEPYDVIGPGGALRVERAAVMGVHAAPFNTVCSGRKDLVLVRLAPPAAQRIVGRPMAQLAGRWAALEALDTDLARALVTGVSSASDWAGRFRAAERMLGERLAGAEVCRAAAAWEAIRRAGGAIRIDELARSADAGQRRFTAEFRRRVGVGPKTAARLARFNRVLRAMGRTGARPTASDAADYGYFDQPHMLGEFRAFAGAAPGAVLKSAAAFTLRA